MGKNTIDYKPKHETKIKLYKGGGIVRTNLIVWEAKNGFKAKWVAEKLGISGGAWSKIKKGTSTPSIDIFYSFKEAFPDADVLELFKNF